MLRRPSILLSSRATGACFLSSARKRTFQVGQGGRLVLDLGKAAAVVKVATQWVDSCSLTISRWPGDPGRGDAKEPRASGKCLNSIDDDVGLTVDADEAQGQLTIAHNQELMGLGPQGTFLVEAEVPELFSLDVLVLRGSVSVSNKLKGGCEVQLGSGDISVGTVRGETIRLSTGAGHVKVDELEGNIDIKATGDVSARLINGSRVKIDAAGDGGTSVAIGALYSSGAHIMSAGNVDVSSCHGRVSVHTAGNTGSVNLSSVNGTAQVSAGEGGATVHMDMLEEGTGSYIRSDGGNINISMSQQVNADLEIAARGIKLPSAFEGEIGQGNAVGRINSVSVEPSRAARYSSNNSHAQDSGGGKIDLVGARGQSLRQYFPGGPAARSVYPKLSVMAKGGSVLLEILSWAENIVRKRTVRDAAATIEETQETT